MSETFSKYTCVYNLNINLLNNNCEWNGNFQATKKNKKMSGIQTFNEDLIHLSSVF